MGIEDRQGAKARMTLGTSETCTDATQKFVGSDVDRPYSDIGAHRPTPYTRGSPGGVIYVLRQRVATHVM